MLVEAGNTRVLVDAGFRAAREISRRLARLNLTGEDVDAVLVTHEHADHVNGVFACARRFDWRILLTHGTLMACRADHVDDRITVIDSHEPFSVGDLGIQTLPRTP